MSEEVYDLTYANENGLRASKPNSRMLGGLPHSWCRPWDWFPQYQQGDQILSFTSPPETWAELCGRSGMALLRDGKVIDYVVTMMN